MLDYRGRDPASLKACFTMSKIVMNRHENRQPLFHGVDFTSTEIVMKIIQVRARLFQ